MPWKPIAAVVATGLCIFLLILWFMTGRPPAAIDRDGRKVRALESIADSLEQMRECEDR